MNKDLKSRLKLTGNWETTLSELQAEYSKMFEKAAPAIFMPMLTGVDNATSRLLGLQPSEETVSMLSTAAQNNAELISSIPDEHIERVRNIIVQNPGNLEAIMEGLQSAEGISERRARNIALDQTRKTYQDVAVQKAQSVGATEGIWIHSHGSKQPRKKHLAAHGKKFKLSEGLPIGDQGQYVMPSEEYGCKCTFKLVIDFGVR